ncbi:MAG: metal-sulfur cluster assembly factor [Candidatus Baldrarchaeia archaeon]
MLTKEQVMDALKKVYDPELGVNIVDLGLIYEVNVKDKNVYIKMTLTTPGCPLYMMFLREVERAIKELGAENVEIELVFDPPWTPERMSRELRKRFGFE